MNESNVLTPKQIAEKTSDTAVTKAGLSVLTMLLLGIAAGAYIAVAGFASNMAAFNLLSSRTPSVSAVSWPESFSPAASSWWSSPAESSLPETT